MGKFAEDRQFDLPETYEKQCIDYKQLRRRLIDEPPDPWDDHPSLNSDINGIEVLGEIEALPTLSDRRTRVFVFELQTELHTLYEFYMNQCRIFSSQLNKVEVAAKHDSRNKISHSHRGNLDNGRFKDVASHGDMMPSTEFLSRTEYTEDINNELTCYSKSEISALYNSLHNLRLFRLLNFDACTRLIDAHRRDITVLSPDDANHLSSQVLQLILKTPLFGDTVLDTLYSNVEQLYADLYCYGNKGMAGFVLSQKASESSSVFYRSSIQKFNIGLRIGAAIVLFFWVLWDCISGDSHPGGNTFWNDSSFLLFRGIGNIILLVWMWTLCVYVWSKFRISYARCFGIFGSQTSSCAGLASTACDLSLSFFTCILCFNNMLRGSLINPKVLPISFAHVLPILLLLYVAQRLLLPLHTRAKPGLSAVLIVLSAPFHSVSFCDGFIGDVLTSTTRVTVDLAFSFLFIFGEIMGGVANKRILGYIGPVLTLFPLWLRFLQCLNRVYETQNRWPNLANALKYAVALAVGSYGAARPGIHNSPLWVFLFVIATFYQFLWDIFMDWDMVQITRKGLDLRPKRLYSGRIVYVIAALVNLILRFCWTVTIVPESGKSYLFSKSFQISVSPYIAAAEIVRRSMWALFRVEAEHIRMLNEAEYTLSKNFSAHEIELVTAAPTTVHTAKYSNFEKLTFSRMDMDSVQKSRVPSWAELGRISTKRMLFLELFMYAGFMISIVGMAFFG